MPISPRPRAETREGLLDAVTAYGFERYLAGKKRLEQTDDPVADLYRGWDNHVEFGLTHPAFCVLMFGAVQPGRRPESAETAYRLLIGLLERVAAAGRLRMPPDLAARTRDIVLGLLTSPADAGSESGAEAGGHAGGDSGGDAVARRALALDAVLAEHPRSLSAAEAGLLHDWLHRLAT
jgi:hypothetical protein